MEKGSSCGTFSYLDVVVGFGRIVSKKGNNMLFMYAIKGLVVQCMYYV